MAVSGYQWRGLAAAGFGSFLLAGCAAEQVQPAANLPQLPPVPSLAAPPPPAVAEPSGRPANLVPASPKIAEMYPGVPELSAAPAPQGQGRPRGDIQLSFEDADLRGVAQVIIRDILGESLVIDPGVQGRVTLRSTGGLTRAQALQTLETLLQANGAVLLRLPGGWRVAASGSQPTPAAGPQLRLPGLGEPGYSLQIHPLRFIGAEEMAKILKPLLPEGRAIVANEAHGMLLVAASSPEQRLVGDTVRVFDVDVMAGQSVLLESLQNADVGAMVFELENIFGSKNGPLAGAVRFVPIERMNAVLVIARQPRYLDEARNWIARLDRTRNAAERRLHVYYVQNGKAANIARTLRGIFGGSASEPVERTSAIQSPTAAPRSMPAGEASARILSGERSIASNAPLLPSAAASVANEGGASGETGPRIIADDSTNAILVLATPKDYASIEEVLAKLDIMPLQVQIETSIVEVTLNDQLRYGVQYFIGNSSSIPAELAAAIIPGAGFSYLFGASVDPRVVISALSTLTEVNVVSSPQVMVLDNQSARLQVGDEVPILTRFVDITASAADPRTVNSVEYRQTGVTLEVMPRVNVSGLVTLEIGQEVSDVSAPDTGAAIQSPTIRQRRILSSVAVSSGETVVLGGLIRESNNVSNSGVPFLHQIPILGTLFGVKSGDISRTELLVFITPRVIRNQREARDATQEIRQKFQAVLALQEKGGALIRTPIQPGIP